MERIKMAKVIGGKRYNTETATLIADNVYWDGNNFERGGRNAWLYKTTGGAYFEVRGTLWQGERDTLIPLSREEALEAWDWLPEHKVTFEEAFDQEAPEAAAPGRPPIGDEPMKLFSVWLTEEQIAWAKAQPGGAGETIRKLIDAAK